MTAHLAAYRSAAALIFRNGRLSAYQNTKKPHRASLSCRYSPDCFTCPLADCAVELGKAVVTNITPNELGGQYEQFSI